MKENQHRPKEAAQIHVRETFKMHPVVSEDEMAVLVQAAITHMLSNKTPSEPTTLSPGEIDAMIRAAVTDYGQTPDNMTAQVIGQHGKMTDKLEADVTTNVLSKDQITSLLALAHSLIPTIQSSENGTTVSIHEAVETIVGFWMYSQSETIDENQAQIVEAGAIVYLKKHPQFIASLEKQVAV